MTAPAFPTEPPDRVYRLYLPGLLKAVVFAIPIFFTLLGLLMIAGAFPDSPPRVIGVIWLAFVGVFWWRISTIPHRIDVFADGRIVFVCLARRIPVLTSAVRSIKPAGNQIGFFVLRHDRGRILLLGQFDGFHEFLSRLKVANPAVELRGC
jgi:hypothetical protein